MAAKRQTHAKRARELALKERRERKREKKVLRAAGLLPVLDGDGDVPEAEEKAESAEWIR